MGGAQVPQEAGPGSPSLPLAPGHLQGLQEEAALHPTSIWEARGGNHDLGRSWITGCINVNVPPGSVPLPTDFSLPEMWKLSVIQTPVVTLAIKGHKRGHCPEAQPTKKGESEGR